MKLRNGAHVDGILDINPTATLAIAQCNASSPLLRLPLELKNLIYRYAFGGHVIHIVKNPDEVVKNPDEGAAKFKNTICCALISEEEAQANFEDETVHRWYVPANEHRHDCCRLKKGAIGLQGGKKPQILRLSPLRCCRQLYNEAHYTPYSENTFSCADPDTLSIFVLSLSQGSRDNHLAVCSIFIEMAYYGVPHSNIWKTALNTCVKSLKNLQSVNISFEWNCNQMMRGARSPAQFEAHGQCRNPLMSDMFVLKKLPLKSFTIVISDARLLANFARYWDLLKSSERWTLQEKREWARYIKKHILK